MKIPVIHREIRVSDKMLLIPFKLTDQKKNRPRHTTGILLLYETDLFVLGILQLCERGWACTLCTVFRLNLKTDFLHIFASKLSFFEYPCNPPRNSSFWGQDAFHFVLYYQIRTTTPKNRPRHTAGILPSFYMKTTF